LSMRIKRTRSRTSLFSGTTTSCAEAASVDFPEALRHRRDSSPSDEAIGGLFFDSGPIRTTRSPRREHSRERESNLDVVASTASARRPATPRRRPRDHERVYASHGSDAAGTPRSTGTWSRT
jgi:hypothetical protein